MNDSQSQSAMVQSIDFLPASYHRAKQQHQKKVWRRALLGVSLTLIVMGTLRPFYVQSTLIQARNRMTQQANGMLSQLEDPSTLHKRIEFLTTQANLRVGLRLHASPTRVLHAVTSSLPPFVTVTEYRATFNEAAGRATPPATEQEDAYPEQTDLKRLHAQRRTTMHTVSLKGIAPNELAVTKYLASLQKTGLFVDVKPIVSEPFTYRKHLLRSFTFHLQVARPDRHSGQPPPSTDDSRPSVASRPTPQQQATTTLNPRIVSQERIAR